MMGSFSQGATFEAAKFQDLRCAIFESPIGGSHLKFLCSLVLLQTDFLCTLVWFGFPAGHNQIHFDNNLILVRPRIRHISLRQHSLEFEYFLVLLTRLPRICYTMEMMALKMASRLYTSQYMQLHEDRVLGIKYFHFRTLIEVFKPLKRIFRVATSDC